MSRLSAGTRPFQPHVEALEDRLNPTTFFPTSSEQLAEALRTANVNRQDDVIDLGERTFTLTSALPDIEADGGHVLTIRNGTIQRSGKADPFRVLSVGPGANLTVEETSLRGGKVSDAGAGILNAGRLTIRDSTLSSHNAGEGQGGAIYNAQAGTIVLITGSTFSGNDAKSGGAIHNAGHLIRIDASTISLNDAEIGGGLAGTGTIDAITNSTFSGNAARVGGGIHNGGTITLLAGSTIAHNVALKTGGGLHNSGTIAELADSILGDNNAVQGGKDLHSGSIASTTHNLIETPDGHSVRDRSAGNIVGKDGRLGGLADNGGRTMTHALLDGSPAINAGGHDRGAGVDQRGYEVPTTDDGADIGAVESEATAPPAVVRARTDLFAVGLDGKDVDPHVKAYNADGSLRYELLAYEQQFRGGVRVATGDVNNDGIDDIITGAGVGGGPRVRVFDGATGLALAGPLGSFFAFEESGRTGIHVAAGDVDADGHADVIVSQGAGGTAEVRVFSGATGGLLSSFIGGETGFSGGHRVAAGNVTGDKRAEVIVTPGTGAAPWVHVFEGVSGTLVDSFTAFVGGYTGGASLAVGDVNGDGIAEILAARASSGSNVVNIFDFNRKEIIDTVTLESGEGIHLGVIDVNGDGNVDILTTRTSSAEPGVTALDGVTHAEIDSFFTFDPPGDGGKLGEHIG